MSDYIGKEVYLQVRKSNYGYSPDVEWRSGKIVGRFVDGDVLVEYDEDELGRETIEDIAFTKDDETPIEGLQLQPPVVMKEQSK